MFNKSYIALIAVFLINILSFSGSFASINPYDAKMENVISKFEKSLDARKISKEEKIKKYKIITARIGVLKKSMIKSGKYSGKVKMTLTSLSASIYDRISKNNDEIAYNTDKIMDSSDNRLNSEVKINGSSAGVIELDNLQKAATNTISALRNQNSDTELLRDISKKESEIKNTISIAKIDIKASKDLTKINRVVSETQKKVVLKEYAAATEDISIKDDIIGDQIKDEKAKIKAVNVVMKGFKNGNNYNIFIESPLDIETVKSDLIKYDANIKIKEYFYDDGMNTYKISMDVNSLLRKELLANIGTGELPEKLLGYKIAKPGYAETVSNISTLSTDLTGEDTKSTWGVEKFGADKYFDYFKDNKKVLVGVIDTGIDATHPDLKDNVSKAVSGYNFVDYNNDANDLDSHGTHVSGTIAAEINGKGIMGVNPYAEIVPIKVIGEDGGSYQSIVEGIKYAADNGVKVVNMSIGGGGSPDSIICTAIKDAYLSKGMISVVAAGNESSNAEYFVPANCDYTITVSATDKDLFPAYFSNFGYGVDVAAPGMDVYSSVPGGKYARYQGTSMASPHVAGLVSILVANNPNISFEQVQEILNSYSLNLNDSSGNNFAKFPDTKKIFDKIFLGIDSNVNCSSFEHLEGGKCILNALDCLIENGKGQKNWANGEWSICQVKTCNDSYFENADRTKCEVPINNNVDYSNDCSSKKILTTMNQGDYLNKIVFAPVGDSYAFYGVNYTDRAWKIYRDGILENTGSTICENYLNSMLQYSSDGKHLMYNLINMTPIDGVYHFSGKLFLDGKPYASAEDGVYCTNNFSEDGKNIFYKSLAPFSDMNSFYKNTDKVGDFQQAYSSQYLFGNDYQFTFFDQSSGYKMNLNGTSKDLKYSRGKIYYSYYSPSTKDSYYVAQGNDAEGHFVDIYKNGTFMKTYNLGIKAYGISNLSFFDNQSIGLVAYNKTYDEFNYYLDGKKIDNYIYNSMLVDQNYKESVSPDGKKYLYFGQKQNGKFSYMFSGIESEDYDWIYSSAISPDFTNYAVLVQKYGRQYFIINGKQYKDIADPYAIQKILTNLKSVEMKKMSYISSANDKGIEVDMNSSNKYALYIKNNGNIVYQENNSLYELGCTNPTMLTCSTGTHDEAGKCVSDKKSCSIVNGSGEQTWGNGAWSSCKVISCQDGYVSNSAGTACEVAKLTCSTGNHEESGKCVSDVQGCSVTNGSGQKTWANNSWGSCVVNYCISPYVVNASKTACEIPPTTPPNLSKPETNNTESVYNPIGKPNESNVFYIGYKNTKNIHWEICDVYNCVKSESTGSVDVQKLNTWDKASITFNNPSKPGKYYFLVVLTNEVDNLVYGSVSFDVSSPVTPSYNLTDLALKVKFSLPKQALKAGGSVSMPEYINSAGKTCTAFAAPIPTADQGTYGPRSVIEFKPDGTYIDSNDENIISKVTLGQQLLFQAPYSGNFFLSKVGYIEQCR